VSLEDVADPTADPRQPRAGSAGELLSQDPETPFLSGAQASDESQEGRLARTGGARQQDDLPGPDVGVDVEEDLLAQSPGAEKVADVTRRNRGFPGLLGRHG
jgi:hypothetical protein